MSRRSWADFNETEEAILAGWLAFERQTYGQLVQPHDRILVIGCGSGRDLLPFLAAGHDAIGVEPSPGAVQALRRMLAAHGYPAARVIESEVETVVVSGKFDVIVFSNLCYCYLRESSRRIAVITALRQHLSRSGRLLVTYLRASEGRRSRALSFARFTARLTRSDWRPERNDVLQRLRNESGTFLHYEHWFTREEIETEASQAGLIVLRHWSPEGVPTIVLGRCEDDALNCVARESSAPARHETSRGSSACGR